MTLIEAISIIGGLLIAGFGLMQAKKKDAATVHSGIIDGYKNMVSSLQADYARVRLEGKELQMEIKNLEVAFDACIAEKKASELEREELKAEIARLKKKYES